MDVAEGRQLLLQRLRQNKEWSKAHDSASCVRTGIPSVPKSAIDGILQARTEQAELAQRRTQQEDLARRRPEYKSVFTEVPAAGDVHSSLTLREAVPMADVDAKYEVLDPLLTLFRICMLRNRVRRRLEKLQTRSEKPMEVLHAASMSAAGPLQLLPCLHVDHNEVTLPDAKLDDEGIDLCIFQNAESFGTRAMREPFQYRLRGYSREHFPEFVLNISAEAADEVAVFQPKMAEESPAPSLGHFTQPLVTLETYDTPAHSYNLRPLSPYADWRPILPCPSIGPSSQMLGSQQMYADGGVDAEGPQRSAVLTATALADVPRKMYEASAADSLSDSNASEDLSFSSFEPSLAWQPHIPDPKNASMAVKEDTRDQSFDTFISKYA